MGSNLVNRKSIKRNPTTGDIYGAESTNHTDPSLIMMRYYQQEAEKDKHAGVVRNSLMSKSNSQ